MTNISQRRWTDRIKLGQVLGIIILILSALTLSETTSLRNEEAKRNKAVEALSTALTLEQNARRAAGKEPVTPDPDYIVENPDILAMAFRVEGEKVDLVYKCQLDPENSSWYQCRATEEMKK